MTDELLNTNANKSISSVSSIRSKKIINSEVAKVG